MFCIYEIWYRVFQRIQTVGELGQPNAEFSCHKVSQLSDNTDFFIHLGSLLIKNTGCFKFSKWSKFVDHQINLLCDRVFKIYYCVSEPKSSCR